MKPLTPRELEAMDLLADDADRTNDEIAALMSPPISGDRVKHILSGAYAKYGVEGRAKAAVVHVRNREPVA